MRRTNTFSRIYFFTRCAGHHMMAAMRIWGVSFATVGLLFISISVISISARADLPSNEWSKIKHPTSGAPSSIGTYADGCLSGAQTLPLDGTGYQAMKTLRNRYYGHSSLIEFITRLGMSLDSVGSAMLIGDMAQPRGGPLPYGHASHQIGLDVDIWYWTHPDQRVRSLTEDERNSLNMKTVLTPKGTVDTTKFTAETITKLKFAATDARVERIFVHPAIKKYLCAKLPANERHWLHTLRPYAGHDDHFHVRLACGSDSPNCIHQEPQAAGDGCNEVAGYVANPASVTQDLESGFHKIEALIQPTSTLPGECQKLLKAQNVQNF